MHWAKDPASTLRRPLHPGSTDSPHLPLGNPAAPGHPSALRLIQPWGPSFLGNLGHLLGPQRKVTAGEQLWRVWVWLEPEDRMQRPKLPA